MPSSLAFFFLALETQEDMADSDSRTFLKRKGGLFKKAHELSVLCSVDVAVIIFGHNKKLYEFSSGDIRETLGKYQYVRTPTSCLPAFVRLEKAWSVLTIDICSGGLPMNTKALPILRTKTRRMMTMTTMHRALRTRLLNSPSLNRNRNLNPSPSPRGWCRRISRISINQLSSISTTHRRPHHPSTMGSPSILVMVLLSPR